MDNPQPILFIYGLDVRLAEWTYFHYTHNNTINYRRGSDTIFINDMEYKQFYYKGEPTDYYVSPYGDIYSMITDMHLNPHITHGYKVTGLQIKFKLRTMSIHKIVALTYIGDIPKGMNVDHIDENKLNNHFSNLEIVTHRENGIRYWNNHRIPSDDYPDSRIHQICDRLKNGEYYKDVAVDEDIPVTFILDIANGTVRNGISAQYLPFPIESLCGENTIYYEDLKNNISSLISSNKSNKEIYKHLGLLKSNGIEKIIVRTRKKLGIRDPKYFNENLVNSITELIEGGYSNKQILTRLNIEYNTEISFLLTRLRKKCNIPDFNPAGVPIDTQEEILRMMRLGYMNGAIEESLGLERDKYLINLFGRLRQHIKHEEDGSTTIP